MMERSCVALPFPSLACLFRRSMWTRARAHTNFNDTDALECLPSDAFDLPYQQGCIKQQKSFCNLLKRPVPTRFQMTRKLV